MKILWEKHTDTFSCAVMQDDIAGDCLADIRYLPYGARNFTTYRKPEQYEAWLKELSKDTKLSKEDHEIIKDCLKHLKEQDDYCKAEKLALAGSVVGIEQ